MVRKEFSAGVVTDYAVLECHGVMLANGE